MPDKKKKDNYWSKILAIVLLLLCIVFGVIFLVNDWDTVEQYDSNLHYYVIAVIVNTIYQWYYNNVEPITVKQKIIFCSKVILWLVFGIWGYFETVECDYSAIRNTQLWTYAYVMFILEFIFAGLGIMCCPCILCKYKVSDDSIV